MPRHSREDDRRRSLPYDDSSRDRRSHHHKVYCFVTPSVFIYFIYCQKRVHIVLDESRKCAFNSNRSASYALGEYEIGFAKY